MIPLVREEVFLSLREKFLYRRPNNSRDTPSSLPPDQASVLVRAQVGGSSVVEMLDGGCIGNGEMDELSSYMRQMKADDAGWDVRSRGKASVVDESQGYGGGGHPSHTPELTDGSTGVEYDEDLESDDDGGGAKL